MTEMTAKKKPKKFFETDEFKKLNKSWNTKLKQSGFDDIESETERESYNCTKQYFTVDRKYIEYNRQCTEYFNSGRITDKTDLFIFEKHIEGIPNLKIAELLQGEKMLKKLTRMAVGMRITRLLKCAGIDQVKFNL